MQRYFHGAELISSYVSETGLESSSVSSGFCCWPLLASVSVDGLASSVWDDGVGEGAGEDDDCVSRRARASASEMN